MSGLMMMLVVWGVLTVILIGLIIYRAILGTHEEVQVFLDRAEAALENEQIEVLKRINRLDPVIRWFGIASGGLLLIMTAWWIYQGLYGVQTVSQLMR